jgi:sensor c-di-GMP phosphodiesterase-like protein
LKDKGFRFSVDDFGTGYSSLAYLHSFPIDELKIDKSFINQIAEKGTAIIDAIVSLSQSFGLKVVAEGVETRDQLEVLAEKNVSSVQGYYYAKPMPRDEFIEWVKTAK